MVNKAWRLTLQTEGLYSLLQTLKENVGLYGNIVLSLETQKKISSNSASENPNSVVPIS